ncbi:hypothetical protein F5X68DRAFT_229798 [Plectosphaerella plurivora]|uniref:Uncharacterized protein n=1 Tax=Plectosphaerella plurivora TaxID=936078 RepID=A0A9P8VGZ5_9PEZI|nr:hypothetical protein F5X68DRAFT_229798 [Plectosphaerella plurivora]
MSLNGDEVVAVISGCVILILFLSVLCIWLCFRDPNRNNPSIDAESRQGLSDTPPVISLTLLEPSALPKSHHDVLGRAAETGPGAANWPLPQNQIRIPLQPRPKRRTLSSELSPFGYIRRSNLSDLASIASNGGGGGGGSAPNTRPASISAAWLSPSRAMFARGALQGSNSPAPSTAPAGPSSPAQPQQQPLSPV